MPLRRASQPSVKGFLPPSGCRGLQNAAITVTVDIAFALPQRLFESCCRQLLWVQAAYLTIYCMKLVKLGWQYTPPPHLHRNRALAPYLQLRRDSSSPLPHMRWEWGGITAACLLRGGPIERLVRSLLQPVMLDWRRRKGCFAASTRCGHLL